MAKILQCNSCGLTQEKVYILTNDNSFLEDFAICEPCVLGAYEYLQNRQTDKSEPSSAEVSDL